MSVEPADYAAIVALPIDGIVLTAAPGAWLRGYERYLAARGAAPAVRAVGRPVARWLVTAEGCPTLLLAPPAGPVDWWGVLPAWRARLPGPGPL